MEFEQVRILFKTHKLKKKKIIGKFFWKRIIFLNLWEKKILFLLYVVYE